MRSGISSSTLSRYLSGERTPSIHGGILTEIVSAICTMGDGRFDESEVREDLINSIVGGSVDLEAFPVNFQHLMDALGLNGNHLSRSLGFDPSYISRIRRGQRYPANILRFIGSVSHYVAQAETDASFVERFMGLMGCSFQEASDPRERERLTRSFLGSKQPLVACGKQTDAVAVFLKALDGFDLDSYMERLRLNEIEIPPAPPQSTTRRFYSGGSEMVQAELDFLTIAVASPSLDDIIVFNDMPFEQMVEDVTFPRKVMMGMALLIRKGIRIHIVHDSTRSLDELIKGVEGWIPVYMTGQMDSSVLPVPANGAFQHALRSAGTVAVRGEATQGNAESGRFLVTTDPDDVSYYRTQAMHLLDAARPFLRVFHGKDAERKEEALADLERRVGPATVPVCVELFRSLSIVVNPGNHAVISKTSHPAMDVLIEHPGFVAAVQRLASTGL